MTPTPTGTKVHPALGAALEVRNDPGHPFRVALSDEALAMIGLRLGDVCAACDVSETTVRRWRAGARWPWPEQIAVLVKLLGAEVTDLFPEFRT